MNLPGVLHLGTRYLARHRMKATLLIAAISISLFLPFAISSVVQQAETQLRARAEITPLVLGSKGSPLDLVFNGLYFQKPKIETIPQGAALQLQEGRQSQVIPIYARYEARDHRIVGTTLDYFRFRDLKVAKGRMIGRLGDCVLGSAAAEALKLGPGDMIQSKSEQMIDIAGVYPLNMRITGVLAANSSPDDHAIFCDLKTTWIIEGIAHGHQEEIEEGVGKVGEDGKTQFNAALKHYQEVTDDNVDTFHFHGDPADFPITTAIVLPRDQKAETILLGKFVGEKKTEQLIRPRTVMIELFDTVFQIRDFVVFALAAVGIAAAIIAINVFLLSNRLRAREFESLANIGADPITARALVLFEAIFVVATSALLAFALLMILKIITPILLPIIMSS